MTGVLQNLQLEQQKAQLIRLNMDKDQEREIKQVHELLKQRNESQQVAKELISLKVKALQVVNETQ